MAGRSDPFGEHLIVGLVWRCLDAASDCRPRVATLARFLGRSERQLRREWAGTLARTARH